MQQHFLAREYQGRHRDDSIEADVRRTRRDYCAQAFGQWYKPRHSSEVTR